MDGKFGTEKEQLTNTGEKKTPFSEYNGRTVDYIKESQKYQERWA